MSFPRMLAALSFALLVSSAAAQDLLSEFPGSTICGIGDLDGDNFGDLVVADALADNGEGLGLARVISGATGATIVDLAPRIPVSHFGQHVTRAGDLNGDGIEDVLVSDTRGSVGRVWAFSGASGLSLRRWDGSGPGGTRRTFGASIVGFGDADGDGHDDFAVGAPGEGMAESGQVTAYSGRTGELLFSRTNFFSELTGSLYLGYSLAPAGDVNHDGIADVLAGKPGFTLVEQGLDGFDVLSGSDGSTLMTWGFPGVEDYWGYSVGNVGDVNADGAPDYSVSGLQETFVVSSATGGILTTFEAQPETLAAIGGEMLFRYAPFSFVVPDVDGNGVDEVAVIWEVGQVPGNSRKLGCTLHDAATGAHVLDVLPFADGRRFEGVVGLGDANGNGLGDIGVALAPSATDLYDADEFATAVQVLTRIPDNGGVICLGLPNSTGAPATLTATSPSGFSAAANDVTLEATGLPVPAIAILSVSLTKGVVFFPGGSMGRYCLAGPVTGRVALLTSSTGTLSYSPDIGQIPLFGAGGATVTSAMPGDTFNFQLWNRDTGPMGATSNFSGAVGIEFQ